MSAAPQMVQAQVLHDSIFHRYKSTLDYDGAILEGFEPINAVDWRDFSIFRAELGETHLQIQVSAETYVDTVVVWPVTGLDDTTSLDVESSTDGISWTPRGSITVSFTGAITWQNVSAFVVPASGYVRFVIDSDVETDWRQLSVGKRLQFPIGQWQGINPPNLTQGVIVDNVIAMNGSVLARNLRRVEKNGEISLNFLKPDWVRTEWEALASHAKRYAFWYRWHPIAYPNEVAFAVADSIQAPTNDRPPPLMAVKMPIMFLT